MEVKKKQHCDEIKYSEDIWEDLYVIWIHFLLVYPGFNTVFISHHHHQIGLLSPLCITWYSRVFDSGEPIDDSIRGYNMKTDNRKTYKFPSGRGWVAYKLAMTSVKNRLMNLCFLTNQVNPIFHLQIYFLVRAKKDVTY